MSEFGRFGTWMIKLFFFFREGGEISNERERGKKSKRKGGQKEGRKEGEGFEREETEMMVSSLL
jgi:hypothetical protein